MIIFEKQKREKHSQSSIELFFLNSKRFRISFEIFKTKIKKKVNNTKKAY